MGAVHFSIDKQLLKCLKQTLPLTVFVETGTFEGQSIAEARPYFNILHTVELSAEHYAKALLRFQGDSAIFVHRGNSVSFLQDLSPSLVDQSVLYWLDAHWCVSAGTAGDKSQCPLLQELEAIRQLNSQSVIFIDDARYFLAPPPQPHEISQWPNFDSVVNQLRSLSSNHEVIIFNDLIIFYPASIRGPLYAYARENAMDWHLVLSKSRQYDQLTVQVQKLKIRLEEAEYDRGALQRTPVYRVLRKLGLLGKLAPQRPPGFPARDDSPPLFPADRAIPSNPGGSISCIAVDLTPLLPGAENGGAKLLAIDLIKSLSELLPACTFILLTSSRNHEEIAFLDSRNVRRVCALQNSQILPGPSSSVVISRLRLILSGWLKGHLPLFWVERLKTLYRFFLLSRHHQGGLIGKLGAELLFCPFTVPFFHDPQIPTVSVMYDLRHRYYPGFFKTEDRLIRDNNFLRTCRLADRLICISDFVRKSVLENSDLSPDRVVSIPIRLFGRLKKPRFENIVGALKRHNLAANEFLLYPANFWPHKNHRMLLVAFAMFRSRHPESSLRLILTGWPDKNMQDLQEAVSRMGLHSWVLLPGYLEDDIFAALLASCRALLFPSLYEGFGMPLLEAMAFGKPVLSSKAGSLPEVGGDAALYFDPKKPEDILKSLEQIAKDPLILAALAARSEKRIAAFGSASQMALEYLEIFRIAQNDPSGRLRIIQGIYADGWTGNRLTIQYDSSPARRSLEILLNVSGAYPFKQMNIIGTDTGGRTETYRVKTGESLLLKHRLPSEKGTYELAFDPPFRPQDHGISEDGRWLGCLCRKVVVVTGRKRHVQYA